MGLLAIRSTLRSGSPCDAPNSATRCSAARAASFGEGFLQVVVDADRSVGKNLVQFCVGFPEKAGEFVSRNVLQQGLQAPCSPSPRPCRALR